MLDDAGIFLRYVSVAPPCYMNGGLLLIKLLDCKQLKMSNDFYRSQHFVDRKFPNLLEDAVLLMEEALQVSGEKWTPREGLFARASILNSVLMLEAAANASIHTLNLSKPFFSDIDKLSVISKFEYFLQRTKPQKEINRGILPVQAAQELIGIRNSIAYPKPFVTEWKKKDERTFSADLGETQYLKIPKSFVYLKHKEALSALKAAMSFLSLFFKVLCEIPCRDTIAFLTSNMTYPLSNNLSISHNRKWIYWHEKWNIEVDFLVDVQEVKAMEKHVH